MHNRKAFGIYRAALIAWLALIFLSFSVVIYANSGTSDGTNAVVMFAVYVGSLEMAVLGLYLKHVSRTCDGSARMLICVPIGVMAGVAVRAAYYAFIDLQKIPYYVKVGSWQPLLLFALVGALLGGILSMASRKLALSRTVAYLVRALALHCLATLAFCWIAYYTIVSNSARWGLGAGIGGILALAALSWVIALALAAATLKFLPTSRAEAGQPPDGSDAATPGEGDASEKE